MTHSALPAAAPQPEPVELLAGGEVAFARILRRIDEAQRSIFARCFEWRDDETGEVVAHYLLKAAERGVAVTILKDRVGMHYEYLEGPRQSFFHKTLDLPTRMRTLFLMAVYNQWGSLRQRENPLATSLLAHPNVTVINENRFDHSKLYTFDDELLILGGMGIGDDFRYRNVDFMVELRGRDVVARYVARDAGRVAFDPSRRIDFLLNSRRGDQPDGDTLIEQRLRLIDSAQHRLTIEMAYLGDGRCTEAVIAAVKRGVRVTLLTAQRSSVITDLNLFTCDQILRRTGQPENLRIVLHPRMVHGKAIVVDSRVVDIGSANFTPLSHGSYEEVNLYCQDTGLAEAVEAAIEDEIRLGRVVQSPVPYRRFYMAVERAVAHYQGRRKAVVPAAREFALESPQRDSA